ncbi:helix-turn-helix transcriptional regulator [Candidatus Ferrigenium straubiae]|jgi:predicted DNA-binding transcriptional regulator AlpA|uniref:helix-turn-helix transcriptional regulator n=1 Tax=Candidatus Ferrigenium straubiae TaxID=2919506 RepID=UPI003F4AD610
MSEQQLRFIGLKTVCNITGLSKSTIYGGRISDFPRPVKINGIGAAKQSGSRWVDSEIRAWMASRIQLRDAQLVSASLPATTKQQPTKPVSQ